MGNDVILVGGFHEIIELCNECGFNVIGIIDSEKDGTYCGVPIIGRDEDATQLYSSYSDCRIIITPDSPIARERLVLYYKAIGYKFATLISPFAHVSKSAVIGEGTVIQTGVNVSASTTIGSFCKLNTNSNVMHDNSIGDYSTIAPNAVLLGRVTLGREVYIGANSTILPGIKIGAGSTVGAGAVVTRNVCERSTVKGVPAK